MAVFFFIVACAIPVAFAFCVVKAWRAWLEIVELHARRDCSDD